MRWATASALAHQATRVTGRLLERGAQLGEDALVRGCDLLASPSCEARRSHPPTRASSPSCAPRSSSRPVTRVAWCASADAVAHLIVEHLDDRLGVTDADGHHLQRVRRLRTGELITAADGAGHWREYTITATQPGALTLEARAAPATEPILHPPLRVACALTKGEHPDAVVRHCSEVGVDAVLLVVAARSVVRWDAERATRAVTRLRRVAREAAGQCRRARLLTVEPAVPLADLAGQPGLLV